MAENKLDNLKEKEKKTTLSNKNCILNLTLKEALETKMEVVYLQVYHISHLLLVLKTNKVLEPVEGMLRLVVFA